MVMIPRGQNKSTSKRLRRSACERIMDQLDPVADYDVLSIPSDVDSISLDTLMDERFRIWCPVKLSKTKKSDGTEKLVKKPINRLKMQVPCTMSRMPDGSYMPPDIRFREAGMTSQPKARWKYSEAVDFCRDYPKLAKMPSKRNPPQILAYPCGSPMLGIVLPVARSGLAILDVDGCFDEQGNLDPAVSKWVAGIKGYIERSPSGRGLRGLFLAELPFARAVLEHPDGFTIEIFCHGPNAWATFTGDTISQDRKIYRQPVLEEELCALYVAQESKKQIAAEAKKAQALAAKKARQSSTPSTTTPTPQSAPMLSVGSLTADDAALVDRIMTSKHGAKFAELWEGQRQYYRKYGYYRAQAIYWLLHRVLWWSGGNVDRSVNIVLHAPIIAPSILSTRKLRGGKLAKMADKIRSCMTHFRRFSRDLEKRIIDLIREKGEVSLGTIRKYIVRKDYGYTDDQLIEALNTLAQAGTITPNTRMTKFRRKPVTMWQLANALPSSDQTGELLYDNMF